MMIPAYASPENIGHKSLQMFWVGGTTYVQEKYDGSNTGFSLGTDGELRMRSHNRPIAMDAPDKMFAPVVDTVKYIHGKGILTPGYIYWGETISKPKHNTLTYKRCPEGYIILYDIDKAEGGWDCMLPDELEQEAMRIGLESAALLATYTQQPSLDELTKLLDTESSLGNTQIEGLVAKRPDLFDRNSRPLMLKYVAAKFREENRIDWKARNPTLGTVVDHLIEQYGTEARWRKAIQHLREQGLIQDAPQDIGPILREIQTDVHRECADDIRDKLFSLAWKDISRGITRNFPNWYKEQLMEAAFPSNSAENAQEVA